MSLTANSSFALEGRTPIEQITGETPDISEYLDFGFYDWVWYKDNAGVGENMFGRWLGVSHRVGNLMSYWILTIACRVISRTTVQRITHLELTTSEVNDRCKEYNERIKEIMHDDNHQIAGDEEEQQLQDWDEYSDLQDDSVFGEEINNVVSDHQIPNADDTFTPDIFEDTYLNKEIAIARGAGDDNNGVQFGRIPRDCATPMVDLSARLTKILCLTPESMRSSSLTDTQRHCPLTLLLRICFHRLTRRANDTYFSTTLSIIGGMRWHSTKRTHSSQCLTLSSGGDRRLKGGNSCANGGTGVPLGSHLRI
jgi:hypothetical protein